MPGSGLLSHKISGTWKYALVGGLASIPLTLGLYWLSGMGNDLSLNMVFFGGIVGGWLAHGTNAERDSVGFRAGVIGALPGWWMLYDFLQYPFTISAPTVIRVLLVLLLLGMFASIFIVVAGAIGFFGARVGGWLATNIGRKRTPVDSS